MRTINKFWLMLSCFLLVMLKSTLVTCAFQTLKVLAIFHEGEEELERAFDLALADLDDEQNSFFHFEAVKRTGVEIDGFKVSRMLCKLLEEEPIAAIFGPRHIKTRTVVASIAGRLGIVHLEYTFRPKDDPIASNNSVNIYPGNFIYEHAIADAVRLMKWQAYTYVYQSYEGLSRIQEALENRGRPNYAIAIRELMPLHQMNQISNDRERELAYETLVKNVHHGVQSNLLLDVESESLPKLLETMASMGMLGDYFMSLIVNLDSSNLDPRDYIPKNSVANITQFKFVKDEDWQLSVEAALLYDAVFAFSDAINALYKEYKYSDEPIDIEPKTLTCLGTDRYEVGPNITDTLLRKTKYGRKTGLMTFDENGERVFEFDLINIQAGHKRKVGEWTGDKFVINRNEQDMNNTLNKAAKSKIFKVTTRVGAPYVIPIYDEEAKGRLIGDKMYEGYCIDLIGKIEEFLGIKCAFELVPDGNYGSYNPATKQWNGLVKRLLDLKADMAICDLTITSERQSAVDFTAPFMNLGISILFSKAEKVKPALFSFMSPFSPEVWMYTATAYLSITLMLFLQARIAPGEWVNPHPCNHEPEELENNFTIMNCLWFSMGTIMTQGCDTLPRTATVRLFAGFWYFFVLINISSYTANLAAFLTGAMIKDSINGVQDLAKQTKISYGSLLGGSTYSFFKNSNTTLYQKIFNTMADAKPSVFTKTNDEGVDRVIKGKRKYAFFMESTTIEYQIQRHCELQQVGGLLDNKGYGIAMPPNSPYRTLISTAILNLQEKGELNQLKDKWWKEKGGGLCDKASSEPESSGELGMSNVGGVFLLLMIGSCVSVLIAMGELFWHVNDIAIEERITRTQALISELKFIFDFSKTKKPVKKSGDKKSEGSQNHEKSGSLKESKAGSLSRLASKESINTNKSKQEKEIEIV